MDFRTQCVIMTLADGGGYHERHFEIQKNYLISKFMYGNLLLLYLFNHQWKKIIY